MLFRINAVISLIGGTMFLMWLGEQITSRGIGNGISLIIMAGIVAHLPTTLVNLLEGGRSGSMSAFTVIAIAAVVIGGTSIFGGIGTMFGTVVGLFIPAVLQSGLVIIGVQSFWQSVAVGSVLVAAVYVDQSRRKAALRGARRSPFARRGGPDAESVAGSGLSPTGSPGASPASGTAPTATAPPAPATPERETPNPERNPQ